MLPGLCVFLLTCSLSVSVQMRSVGAATREELVLLYRRYADAKDKDKLRTLVYWPGVQDRERRSFDKSIEDDSKLTVKSVDSGPLAKDQMMEYTLEGVTYRPTLTPIGTLVVAYVPQGTARVLATTYLVGVKDNRYYITLASPVPR